MALTCSHTTAPASAVGMCVCSISLFLSLCLPVYLFYRCLQCKIVETLFLTESLRSPTQLKVALDFEPAERVCKETKKLKTKPQQQQQQQQQ